MLDSTNLLAFFLAATLLAFTPGPSILYVLARTLAGGKSDGFASTMGTAVGGLCHVFVSAIGLAAVLAASAEIFTLIKLLGAVYLFYLGVRTIREVNSPAGEMRLTPRGSKRAFWEGIVTEIFNIKVALFFLAFIPQFVDAELGSTVQFIVLGLICVALNMVADLAVVLGASRMTLILDQHSRTQRVFHYGAGGMLMSLGTLVAIAQFRR